MSKHVLVLNSGSSSLKFAVLDPETRKRPLSGVAERLGSEQAVLHVDGESSPRKLSTPSHQGAVQGVLSLIEQRALRSQLHAVGHRVVHGGEQFRGSTRITTEVLDSIRGLNHLAPLHNPLNVLGIEAAREALDDLAQVAVFDTSFHQSMPEHAYRYAVPESWYREHGVRKYGFHGTSHRFVASELAQRWGRPLDELNLLSAHLGNGCSATAISGGRSVDTTMGMTPLAGVVMGTRSGDIDPGVVTYMSQRLKGGVSEVDETLNRQSGLLGLSDGSSDMRELLAREQEGDTKAGRAVEVFCFRLAASLAALAVSLPAVDALVFTGGIGEHSAAIRARILARLGGLRLWVHAEKNERHGRLEAGRIDAGSGADNPRVYVIATDEELMIARDTVNVLS